DNFDYDPKGSAKQFVPEAADRLEKLAESFECLDSFERDSLEHALDALANELGIKRAALIHPARLAVSGMTMGPGLYDLLVTVGRERTIRRMRRAAEHIRTLKHDTVTD
ncbi:MAG: glutamate--tRNA ligase, partial [Candidatus Zixiibacteriota bacterium]